MDVQDSPTCTLGLCRSGRRPVDAFVMCPGEAEEVEASTEVRCIADPMYKISHRCAVEWQILPPVSIVRTFLLNLRTLDRLCTYGAAILEHAWSFSCV